MLKHSLCFLASSSLGSSLQFPSQASGKAAFCLQYGRVPSLLREACGPARLVHRLAVWPCQSWLGFPREGRLFQQSVSAKGNHFAGENKTESSLCTFLVSALAKWFLSAHISWLSVRVLLKFDVNMCQCGFKRYWLHVFCSKNCSV